MTRNTFVRFITLIALSVALNGCIDRDVAMVNPRTGEKLTCTAMPGGLDPWSQTTACVTDHEAQGWIRADRG